MQKNSYLRYYIAHLQRNWTWLGWAILLPVCLYFQGIWRYCLAFAAIALFNEILARGLFRLFGTRKPILILTLWSTWIVGFYFYTAWQSPNVDYCPKPRASLSKAPDSYYNFLTKSLAQGHLDIGISPSKELLALANPYDPKGRDPNFYLLDASLYQGKYFLYFGITPVLTFFYHFMP